MQVEQKRRKATPGATGFRPALLREPPPRTAATHEKPMRVTAAEAPAARRDLP